METTSKFSSYLPLNPNRIPFGLTCRKKPEPAVRKIIMASIKGTNGGDYYQAGKLVDDGMIVLRMRIKEIKLLEKSSDDELPASWMEWEKRYFLHYNKDIYEAIGLLQNYLMNVRPSFGLGMMVLLMFSVAISIGVLLFQGLEIAKGIFSEFLI